MLKKAIVNGRKNSVLPYFFANMYICICNRRVGEVANPALCIYILGQHQ